MQTPPPQIRWFEGSEAILVRGSAGWKSPNRVQAEPQWGFGAKPAEADCKTDKRTKQQTTVPNFDHVVVVWVKAVGWAAGRASDL